MRMRHWIESGMIPVEEVFAERRLDPEDVVAARIARRFDERRSTRSSPANGAWHAHRRADQIAEAL